jgi:hypothetical protein
VSYLGDHGQVLVAQLGGLGLSAALVLQDQLPHLALVLPLELQLRLR